MEGVCEWWRFWDSTVGEEDEQWLQFLGAGLIRKNEISGNLITNLGIKKIFNYPKAALSRSAAKGITFSSALGLAALRESAVEG